MRRVVACLVLAGSLSGCASTLTSLQRAPARFEDAMRDPVRREHVITQVGLEASTASVAIVCAALVPFPLSLGVCPLVAVLYNYVSYEFILEPLAKDRVRAGKPSTTGPYWERGPYTDEGEVFVRP